MTDEQSSGNVFTAAAVVPPPRFRDCFESLYVLSFVVLELMRQQRLYRRKNKRIYTIIKTKNDHLQARKLDSPGGQGSSASSTQKADGLNKQNLHICTRILKSK
ncbi:Hypothetical protein FKW44_015112 [Caligus rogercresseyi]|uniref:Uncharacterized protein n=1 Tax=Caligus rogercresseyi TaxID=217165 RepID=A0A7T8H0G5_CALRO|nr:Hypothetical protein FKW44_015112 [Caligus rogercresseyi]